MANRRFGPKPERTPESRLVTHSGEKPMRSMIDNDQGKDAMTPLAKALQAFTSRNAGAGRKSHLHSEAVQRVPGRPGPAEAERSSQGVERPGCCRHHHHPTQEPRRRMNDGRQISGVAGRSLSSATACLPSSHTPCGISRIRPGRRSRSWCDSWRRPCRSSRSRPGNRSSRTSWRRRTRTSPLHRTTTRQRAGRPRPSASSMPSWAKQAWTRRHGR